VGKDGVWGIGDMNGVVPFGTSGFFGSRRASTSRSSRPNQYTILCLRPNLIRYLELSFCSKFMKMVGLREYYCSLHEQMINLCFESWRLQFGHHVVRSE
jgi:hypothetical protein